MQNEQASAAACKPVVLSGIQPSGELCIGNYIGAIKNWVSLLDSHECIFLVVDLHALTVPQVPAKLRERCLSFVAQYIACGITPEKSCIAIQSHVREHAELAWVLNTLASMGELSRMTQFKDKSARHDANINVGLFTYPVLMAADILLYQADCVPVGQDQKQHLELTRDLAQRFNSRYSPTFTVPEVFIPPVGARVMSLQQPENKMSKSDPDPNGYIALLDGPDRIRAKLRRAVTDSHTDIVYAPEERPGLANLLVMYSALEGSTPQQVADRFAGKSYAEFKSDLADLTVATLEPVQERYRELMSAPDHLRDILARGRDQATRRARKTLQKVYRKVGLVQLGN